jgi:hypothetical protein
LDFKRNFEETFNENYPTYGAMYNLPFGDQFVTQLAVNFLNKKWSDELENLTTGDLEKTKMSMNYLEPSN